MHFACWVAKATNTHSENVIIIDFLQQQWLRERASLLSYNTWLVLFFFLLTDISKFWFLNYGWSILWCSSYKAALLPVTLSDIFANCHVV
jgi:hypothetical protein